VTRVRKGKSPVDPLTHEELVELAYLEALFTEALRLYPSVPKNAKMAFKDNTLPDGTPVRRGDYIV
jgi:cytochrome P450